MSSPANGAITRIVPVNGLLVDAGEVPVGEVVDGVAGVVAGELGGDDVGGQAEDAFAVAHPPVVSVLDVEPDDSAGRKPSRSTS